MRKDQIVLLKRDQIVLLKRMPIPTNLHMRSNRVAVVVCTPGVELITLCLEASEIERLLVDRLLEFVYLR